MDNQLATSHLACICSHSEAGSLMELDGKEEAISMSENAKQTRSGKYFAKIIFSVKEKSIFPSLVYSCSWPHLKSLQLTINSLNKLVMNPSLSKIIT